MAKFKNGLIREVNEERKAEHEQEALRQKHNISEKNVIVVEKKDIFKTITFLLGNIIQYSAFVILIILAIIGILALIYPTPRESLLNVFSEILKEVKSYLH